MRQNLPLSIPTLDGLRGAAALLVVFTHCANEGWLPLLLAAETGRMGVAIFYALSGFLMMHMGVSQRLDRLALRRYAVARFARVLPLYFLVLSITTLAFIPLGGVSFYGVDETGDLVRSWLFIKGTGVLWSVPVEVHFYLLFPALWWAHDRGWSIVACLGLLIGCLLLAATSPFGRALPYLPFWLHFFLFGVLIRLVIDAAPANRIWLARNGPGAGLLAWVCLGLLALVITIPRDVLVPWMSKGLLTAVLVPAVLCLTVAGAGPFRLLAKALPRWLGSNSYGIYLIHSPVMSVILYLEIDAAIGPVASLLLVLFASLAGAALSLRLFERPVQDWLRQRYASPSIAAQANP